MPAPAGVQRVVGLGLRVAAVLAFLPPLLTRLVLSIALFAILALDGWQFVVRSLDLVGAR